MLPGLSGSRPIPLKISGSEIRVMSAADRHHQQPDRGVGQRDPLVVRARRPGGPADRRGHLPRGSLLCDVLGPGS